MDNQINNIELIEQRIQEQKLVVIDITNQLENAKFMIQTLKRELRSAKRDFAENGPKKPMGRPRKDPSELTASTIRQYAYAEKKLKELPKVNPKSMYVWLKNNYHNGADKGYAAFTANPRPTLKQFKEREYNGFLGERIYYTQKALNEPDLHEHYKAELKQSLTLLLKEHNYYAEQYGVPHLTFSYNMFTWAIVSLLGLDPRTESEYTMDNYVHVRTEDFKGPWDNEQQPAMTTQTTPITTTPTYIESNRQLMRHTDPEVQSQTIAERALYYSLTDTVNPDLTPVDEDGNNITPHPDAY